MKKPSLFLTGILATSFCFAQNLVPNGDFEESTDVPEAPGEWYKCKYWSNVNDHPSFEYPYGSPDYLHTSGKNDVQLPDCVFGHLEPYSGKACVGFVLWHGDTYNYREYLSVKFNTPMIQGMYYQVSFWVTNGFSKWRGNSSSTHFGVAFSDDPLEQHEHDPIKRIPDFEIDGQFWETSWKQVSFLYRATSNSQYVTFGNFFYDDQTEHELQVEDGHPLAYYFMDRVEIYPTLVFQENIPAGVALR